MIKTMKKYLKPAIEAIDIQSLDCFMATAGSGDHGAIPAPKKKKYIFF